MELGPFNRPTKLELNHPRRLESQIVRENRELGSLIEEQHVAFHTLVNLANIAHNYFQYHLDLKLNQSFHTFAWLTLIVCSKNENRKSGNLLRSYVIKPRIICRDLNTIVNMMFGWFFGNKCHRDYMHLCAKPASSMRKNGNFIVGFLPFAVHMCHTRPDFGVES